MYHPGTSFRIRTLIRLLAAFPFSDFLLRSSPRNHPRLKEAACSRLSLGAHDQKAVSAPELLRGQQRLLLHLYCSLVFPSAQSFSLPLYRLCSHEHRPLKILHTDKSSLQHRQRMVAMGSSGRVLLKDGAVACPRPRGIGGVKCFLTKSAK